MKIIQSIWVSLITALVLTACTEDKPEDEYEFIEYLKVEGTCYENHVKESGSYTGSLYHWHNITKDKHSRHGFVLDNASFDPETSFERVKNPYKYSVPFIVRFQGISQDKYSQSAMTLEGISKHTSTVESKDGRQYETTCMLSVTERLDNLPSAQTHENNENEPQ